MAKDSLKEMQKAVLKFEKVRRWKKFHTPKNLAMDVIKEASEILEHFIWATNQEIQKDKERIGEIKEEIGDTLHALLLLADSLDIDLSEAFWTKLEKAKKKYPVKKSRGISGYALKRKIKNP